jgi:hypothetical protein
MLIVSNHTMFPLFAQDVHECPVSIFNCDVYVVRSPAEALGPSSRLWVEVLEVPSAL